jgi:hypothetical protein
MLDEVAIFNRALTPSDVSEMYSRGASLSCGQTSPPPPTSDCSDLLALYHLDGNADDYSGNNNDGTLVNNGDGTFDYTPNPDFNGSDSFVYEICDTLGACDTAAVSITVTPAPDPPVANDDSASTPEDTAVTINVAANDTDVDGNLNPASANTTCANGSTGCADPANGTLVNNGNGTFAYTPNPDYNGPDSFVYEICDTLGACDSATVSITVDPVNDPLVVNDDSASTPEDTGVTINVVANDSDPDGDLDPNSANTACAGCADPANGTLVNNGNGTFAYTPNPDYNGPDSFVYEICDTLGACDTAAVSITVTPAPDPLVANNDSASMPEDTGVTINVVANDSDPDGDLDPNSANTACTGCADPVNGTLVNNGDGTFAYIPNLDYNGPDSFVYEICDTLGACDSATVSITVDPVNDPPVANNDSASTPEDTGVTIDVAANDTDPEFTLDPATAKTACAGCADPVNGTLVNNGSGTFNYTPNPDFNGADSFVYEICDTLGACNTATVSITINPVNDPPLPPVLVSPADAATGVSISTTPEVTVSDPEGDNLTVTFYGRTTPPGTDSDFTLIWLPDTQHYTDDPAHEPNFFAQTQWIVDNRIALNIPFVTHSGDCVQNGNNFGDDSEWLVADAAMGLLEDPVTTLLSDGIPFGLAPGDQDQVDTGGGSTGPTASFNKFFGVSRFQGRGYYGGHFGTLNDNNFELFSASGYDFIIVHLGYDRFDAEVLNWADNLLQTYSNRRAIVVTHYLIDSGNPGSFSSQGQDIYDSLKGNPNLFLMLGGHKSEEGRREDTFNGNTVYSLLANYQSRSNGGNGWLRIMEFSPANNEIRIKTYSPVLDQFEIDADSQFTLNYDMHDSSFQILGTNTNVPSGSSTSIAWPGLDGSTEYEWYVTVDDNNSVTTGTTWSFTTEDIEPPVITILGGNPAAVEVGTSYTDAGATATDNVDGDLTGAIVTTNNVDTNTLGSYSVTYVVSDNNGNTATAVRTVIVEYSPVAGDDSASTLEDTLVTIDVAANDSDPDGNLDPTTANSTCANGSIGCNGAANGSLSDNGEGSITYAPAPDFNGPDSFVYEICDDLGACDTATVSITVTPVADPPVANDDSASTLVYTLVIIDVAANDTDPEFNLDPATANIACAGCADPVNGTLVNNGNGTFAYTPNPCFSGSDSFVYEICDTGGLCNTAAVSITVNPFSQDILEVRVASSSDDTEEVESIGSMNLTSGDLDLGQKVIGIRFNGVNIPQGATIYNAYIQFQADEISSVATTLTIEGEDIDNAPTFTSTNGNISSRARTTASVPWSPVPWTTVGAAGPDQQTPDITSVIQKIVDRAGWTSGNSLVIIMTGTGLRPAESYDGVAAAAPLLHVEYNSGTNARPVASDDSVSTLEDTPLTIAVAANDCDADGNLDPTSANTACAGCADPVTGTLVNNGNGSLDYTPNPDFNGADSFVYEICDTPGACDTATVSITVNPVSDPPTTNDDTASTPEDMGVTIDVAANDTDPEGNMDPASANTACATCTTPPNGSLLNNGDGSFDYTPNPDFNGPDSFVYEICDTGSLCNTATVSITVDPVVDPPVANDDSASTPEDTLVTIDVAANDTDADDNLDPASANTACVTCADPVNGSLVNKGDGTFDYTPNQNYNGPDNFVYKICDTSGACDSATVSITVDPVNDPPVVNDDSVSTQEDTAVTINVVVNDTDPELNLDPNSANSTCVNGSSGCNGAASGTLTDNGNGIITYTPNPDFNGSDSFVYEICDTLGACDTAVVSITVTPSPDPVVANDDSASTPEDTGVAINVIANDTDPDGDLDPATANTACAGCADPVNGTLVNNGDGTFDYMPIPDYNGSDSFVYEICDTLGACDSATVSITVDPVNDPPVANDDSASTMEDTGVTVDVAGNDTDPELNLDPISTNSTCVNGSSGCNGAASGTLTDNGNGTITYTPNPDFNGSDSFVYEICDTLGACDTAVVSITVTPTPDPPVANDDSASMPQDTGVTINVIANDSDPDGDLDPATANTACTGCADTVNGFLANNGDGTFNYTPNLDYNGPDSFVYEICDTGGLCDTAAVSITVNPLIQDILEVRIASSSDDAEEKASGAVSLTSSDLELVFDSGGHQTVGMRFTGINIPQGANITNAYVQFQVDETIPANQTNLTIQGEDVDNAATFTAVSGSITSRPRTTAAMPWSPVPWTTVGEAGPDQQTPDITAVIQEIVDRAGWTSDNSLVIIITGTGERTAEAYDGVLAAAPLLHVEYNTGLPNDPPVANNDSASTPEETGVTIDVAANDTDPEINLDLTSANSTCVGGSSGCNGAANGTLTDNGNGTVTYAPNPDFNGSDSFVYEICDILGACDTATVSITVTPTPDPPVANDDSASTPEDTPVTINVAANDTDPDGNLNPTLANTNCANGSTGCAGPANGSLVNRGDGTFDYMPIPDYNGSDSFVYEICDTLGACDTATVSITVHPVNDPPVANDESASTPEDTVVTIGVAANDTDPELNLDPTSANSTCVNGSSGCNGSANGTLTDNGNGTITYAPNPDFNDSDSFVYEICDTLGACDTAVVSITVTPAPDPPVANDDSASTPEDTTVTIDVASNDTDPDGNLDPASANTACAGCVEPGNGTLINNGNGTFNYTPNPDYKGPDSFVYESCDTLDACDTAVVSITVTLAPYPPVANDDSASTPEDTTVAINVVANDTDPNGNLDPTSANATCAGCAEPGNGTLFNNGDGSFDYTPNTDFNGPDSFVYEICDTLGACDTAVVSIMVTPAPDPPTAYDDTTSTPEDIEVIIDVAANDTDPELNLDPASANTACAGCTDPVNGTLVNNGNGTFAYTPNSDYNGPDSFVYEICDTLGACDTATVSITVDPVNDPPVANDDNASTPEDTPVSIYVESNDTDPDGNLDPASANTTCATCADPSNGTLVNNGDGSIDYIPNLGVIGNDSFVYEICDTLGACDTATVSITVYPSPPMTMEVRVSASSDDAEERDTGSIALTSSDLELVFDGGGHQTVGMRFNGINIPPGANIINAYVQFQVDETIPADPTDLTIQGEKVAHAATFTVTNGSISSRPRTTAAVSWSPAPWLTVGEAGPDQQTPDIAPVIQEIVNQPGWASGNSLVVIITGSGERTAESYDGVPAAAPLLYVEYKTGPPNDPPTANNDSASTPEDTPVTIDVAANDSDPNGNLDPASANTTCATCSDPVNGSLLNNGDGTFDYTPSPDFNALDSFVYEICDTLGACETASVSLTVSPVADPPVANDVTASTIEDTPVTIHVAANDSDPDGNLDPTTANTTCTSCIDPTNGTLVNNGDGTFAHTPDPGFNGSDSFVYEICDTDTLCDTAMVSITVNDMRYPPVANDDSASMPEDTGVTINVVANDSDQDGDLDPTSANTACTGCADPFNGILVNNGNGTFDYTPNPDYNGPESFVYKICDTGLLCDTATVSISVTPVADPPVANGDTATTIEETPVTIDVAANDNDPDGDLDPATANTACAGCADPANGFLANNGDGTFDYTPDTSFSGNDSFVYEICDMHGACDTASVSITVNPLVSDILEVRVASSSDDAEEKASGAVSLTSSDLELVFDGGGYQTLGMRFSEINILQGANITNAYIQFQVDETIPADPTNLTIQGEDVDNALTFTTTTNNISSRPRTTAGVSWSPVPWTTVGEAGPDQQTPNIASVIQEIVNQSGWASGNSLVIIITGTGERTAEAYNGMPAAAPLLHVEYNTGPPNYPPVANNDSASTTEDTLVNIDVAANDTDPEFNLDPASANTACAGCADPGNGTLFNNGDGSFDYMPNPDFNGPDSFVYEICDTGGACDTAAVNITVTPVPDSPTANDDTPITNENTVVTIDVTANDTDPDGNLDPASANTTCASGSAGCDDPVNGTLFNNGNGTFDYTPNPNYSGPDSFVYEICDRGGLCDTAAVSITVNIEAPTTLEVQIAASSDDAEEKPSGSMSLSSSDLDLTLSSSSLMTVGMRFINVAIPEGATISNAYIQFQADEAQSGLTSLTLILRRLAQSMGTFP